MAAEESRPFLPRTGVPRPWTPHRWLGAGGRACGEGTQRCDRGAHPGLGCAGGCQAPGGLSTPARAAVHVSIQRAPRSAQRPVWLWGWGLASRQWARLQFCLPPSWRLNPLLRVHRLLPVTDCSCPSPNPPSGSSKPQYGCVCRCGF